MAFTTPKTNWANGDIPTAQDFNRIEGNTEFGLSANKVLWTGTANAGDTITLNESVYNFRFAIVYFTGQGTSATAPVRTDTFLRGSGANPSTVNGIVFFGFAATVGGGGVSLSLVRAITLYASAGSAVGASENLTVAAIHGVR